MKIGAVYPQIELRGSPLALDQVARAVDGLGFDHLLMYDHVLGARQDGREPPLVGPYDDEDPFHDPLVAFAYLAGITKRIAFYTGVLILPQRQTALLARQAADVDLLSQQRLTLGVGVGWNYVEYAALGQSFETRGQRLDEQIPLLRRLWGEGAIAWQGRFDRLDRAALCPRPLRPIPIYCGGSTLPAFSRAARVADGFIFGGQSVAKLAEQWRQLKGLLDQHDRPVSMFGVHALIMSERYSALTVQAAADSIRAWHDAGGTQASIVSMGQGFVEPDQHTDYFEAVLARAR